MKAVAKALGAGMLVESNGGSCVLAPAQLTLAGVTRGSTRQMKFPADLVPQKVVADDLCVSIVTLWRARRSAIPGFPEPVVLRNMVFWRKNDVGRLEDALMKFEGRGKFEEHRVRAQRNERLMKARPKPKRRKQPSPQDARQLDLL